MGGMNEGVWFTACTKGCEGITDMGKGDKEDMFIRKAVSYYTVSTSHQAQDRKAIHPLRPRPRGQFSQYHAPSRLQENP
jgi:hypothetical protein